MTLAKLTIDKFAELGFTASSSVTIYYACDEASSNGPQWYVATAKHIGGDQAYGTTTMSGLLVTPRHDNCKNEDSVTCADRVGATAMTAAENGKDNVTGLTNWDIM